MLKKKIGIHLQNKLDLCSSILPCKLINPLLIDSANLRMSLLPSLIKTIKENINQLLKFIVKIIETQRFNHAASE